MNSQQDEPEDEGPGEDRPGDDRGPLEPSMKPFEPTFDPFEESPRERPARQPEKLLVILGPLAGLAGVTALYLGVAWAFDRFPHPEVSWPYYVGGVLLTALFIFLGLSESKIENMLKLGMALVAAWVGWDFVGPAGQAVLLGVPLGASSAVIGLFS